MSDWRERAEITADVVLFRYASEAVELETPELYVWDLDKTYLDTGFETLSGLIRTVREKAFQKRNIPGTGTLVRALRDDWQALHQGKRDFPIYFITASPPQMEAKIHDKLAYDGIYPFGIFCKDNLKNLAPSRWSRLTQQVGYKLQALLQLRLHLRREVKQVLWGDDSEADAVIYSLYSDLCARRIEEREARAILRHLKVMGHQVNAIFMLLESIPVQDPIEKIYINLASDTDSDYYLKFGRRIVPTSNTFELALDLFQDRRLSFIQLVNVAHDLLRNYGFGVEDLERSFEDMIRRPLLADTTVEELVPKLKERGLLTSNWVFRAKPKSIATRIDDRIFALEGVTEPWVPERIDYLRDDR